MPWGLALAPFGFGEYSGDLLVGDFGDGLIHAFDPTTGAQVGALEDINGNPITIDGLRASSSEAAAATAVRRLFSTPPQG